MKFSLEKYFKQSRLLQMNISDEDFISEEMKIRTELLLRDIKALARNIADEEIDKELEYSFSNEQMENLKIISKRYNISLYDATALIFYEAVLGAKIDEYKEKYPDKTVVDVYQYTMYYYEYVNLEEVVVVTIYDINSLTRVLFE
jgi:hypothetical protein